MGELRFTSNAEQHTDPSLPKPAILLYEQRVHATYRENLETGLSILKTIQARGENWRGSPYYDRRKVVYAPDMGNNQNGGKEFKKLIHSTFVRSCCINLGYIFD